MQNNQILTMSDNAVERVCRLTEASTKLPQVNIETSHVIHAGMYARTIIIPEGVTLTGALIKIATLLVVSGDVLVSVGDETIELVGYNVLAASKNRKQAFFARTDTHLTMIFTSAARSIEDAESEFTDEADILLSRKNPESNQIIITEE